MRQVLVHAHIFKNAGTTFDDSLLRHFGSGFVDHREDGEFLKGRNDYLLQYLALNPAVQALSSHSLHFRITGNDNIQIHPVYFLRHPLARVWSVYHFEKRQTGVHTEGARWAKDMSLNDYVAWYLEEGSPATIRNIHTIFLSGTGPSPDNMEEKFRIASAYLDDRAASFVVVERYDESMLMLEDRLRAFFPGLDLSYRKKNVSPETQNITSDPVARLLSALDESVAAKLQDANAFDLALYEKANLNLEGALTGMDGLAEKKKQLLNRCRELHS